MSIAHTKLLFVYLVKLVSWAAGAPIVLAFSLAWYLNATGFAMVCIGVSLILYYSLRGMAANRIAITHQSDVLKGFLSGVKFDITITEVPEDLRTEANYLQSWYKLFGNKLFGKEAVSNTPFWQSDPLVVLLAKPKSGYLLGQAKAFLNPLGTSLIIIDRPVDRMDDHAKFILYHEAGHITIDNRRHLGEAHFGRIWRPVTLVIFLCWIQAWWQVPIVIAYAAFIWFIAWNYSFNLVEVIADNNALRRIKNKQQQMILVNDLCELLEESAKRDSKRMEMIEASRLWFLIRAQKKLLKGKPISPLTVWGVRPTLFEIVFVPLFLTWPVVSAQVPVIVLVVMGIALLYGELHRLYAVAEWMRMDKKIQRQLRQLHRSVPDDA
jgi:hypothetical protein